MSYGGSLVVHDTTSGAADVIEIHQAGESVDISGAGFQNGESVSLFWLTSDGSIAINAGKITIGTSTAFSRLGIAVPDSVTAGDTVTVQAVGSMGTKEQAPVLVVDKNPND